MIAKRLGFFLIPILLLLTFTTPVLAANKYIANQRVSVASDEVIDNDFFGAGENVQIQGRIQGDAYLAGADVVIDGVIDGDLLVAGGNVTINGSVNQDVRVASGNVIINGNVMGNVTALAGNVFLPETAFIGGNLVAGAGNVNISGTVEKNIEAAVGNLSLSPTAVVSGDISYTSEDEADINSEASISGTIQKHMAPDFNLPSSESVDNFFSGLSVITKFLSILITLAFGLILIRLFPRYSKNATNILSANPGRALLLGLLAMVVVPVVVIILLITVLGIPIAVIIGFLFFIYMYIARIWVMIALGAKTTELLKVKNTNINMNFFAGLVVYYVISLIPFIGSIFAFFATLAGLGAALVNEKQTYLAARKKEIF